MKESSVRCDTQYPDVVTLAAMQEAEHLAKDPHAKHCNDVEEALRELKK